MTKGVKGTYHPLKSSKVREDYIKEAKSLYLIHRISFNEALGNMINEVKKYRSTLKWCYYIGIPNNNRYVYLIYLLIEYIIITTFCPYISNINIIAWQGSIFFWNSARTTWEIWNLK